jgi:hypothetical protein
MAAVLDPSGSGPTLDDQGRSTGGFLYTDTTIDLAVSTTSVDLEVTFSAPFDDDFATAMVTTDSANGYRLYMESSGANLICTSNTSLTILPTVGTSVDAGTWGYQVGTSISSTGWLPVPTTSAQIDSSSGPTFVAPNPPVSRNTQVNFAARGPINVTCPLYEQTITYTVVANL